MEGRGSSSQHPVANVLWTVGGRGMDALAGLEPMQLVRDLRAGYVAGMLNPMPPRNLVPGATFARIHPAEDHVLDPAPRSLDPAYPYAVPTDERVHLPPHGYWRLPGASWYPDYGLVVAGDALEMVEGCYRFPLRFTRVVDGRFRRAPVHRVPGVALPLEVEWPNNHYHNLIDVAPRIALLSDPHFAQYDHISLLTYTIDDSPVLDLLAKRLLPGNVEVVRVPRKHRVVPDELLMPLPPTDAFAAVPPRWYVEALHRSVTRFRAEGPDRCVYISRAGATKRRVLNEAELIRRLERRGFDIVRTEALSPADVVELMGRTRVLVGQMGAGLANALFCPPGSAVVELSAADCWSGEMFWITQGAGLGFWPVVGGSQPSQRNRWKGHAVEQFRPDYYRRRDADMVVDLDRLDVVLAELLDAEAASVAITPQRSGS